MTSWANSGARDPHLDLRAAPTPGRHLAAPPEHGFAAAVSALCDVLADSGL